MFHKNPTNNGRRIRFSVLFLLILMQVAMFAAAQGKPQAPENISTYQNFNVAIFVQLSDMDHMIADPHWLEESWNIISHSIKVDKVYLETYVDGEQMSKENVLKIKNFFTSKGVKTSGGIMSTTNGQAGDRLAGFDYSNPNDREHFRKIVAFTASIFDEIIFDDLFIFNSRSESSQKAKGSMSWTEYRLNAMKDVYENLVIKNAKSVNPKIHLIIKPPNWYEQYQFSGYNLEAASKLFDEIYVGTETRDVENTTQFLQPYQSYSLMRYFEHSKPGNFGGGWFDDGDCQTMNRYSEEIENTLFAKPKEVTHWHYGDLVETLTEADGQTKLPSILAEYAGYTFKKLDAFLGKLGEPFGVATYKPYSSSGEMFLHNFIGMIGIPMDMYPYFPDDRGTIFLTEAAKSDTAIVSKIIKHLNEDKTVIITSGLLKALHGEKGIAKIAEVEYTGRKELIKQFTSRRIMDEGNFSNLYFSNNGILFPELAYGLVDVEPMIQGMGNNDYARYPILLRVRGLSKGKFYILAVPDNFADLYELPQEILSQIRRDLMQDIPVYLDSPSKICLFVYNNNTFITQSYQPYQTRYNIVIKKAGAKLYDIISGQELKGIVNGETTLFEVSQKPRTYSVYRFE